MSPSQVEDETRANALQAPPRATAPPPIAGPRRRCEYSPDRSARRPQTAVAADAADKPPRSGGTDMINRRAFSALIAGAAGAAAAPRTAWSQSVSKKTVFY